MKVGILTRRYGYNHGSSLQALAMSYIVRQMGYEPEIINYDETAAHPRWRIRPIIDRLLYKIKWLMPEDKRNYLKKRHSQEKRFKKFEEDYFPLSDKVVNSSKQLSQLVEGYKKILLGSDQIWSPILYDSNYLGGFTKEKDKLIPYAPSLGISDIKLFTEPMIKLFQELEYISCREEKGAEILSSFTKKSVPVVLDPTLMVNYEVWCSIANVHKVPKLPKRYIVTYYLGKDIHQENVESKKKELELPIVNISMFNRPNSLKADMHISDLGPGEFLNIIMNADYVITDSFHCSIFSWIFNREFLIFERFKSNETENQNSRIYTLVKTLGCGNRLWGKEETVSIGNFDEEKEKSWDYLKTSFL